MSKPIGNLTWKQGAVPRGMYLALPFTQNSLYGLTRRNVAVPARRGDPGVPGAATIPTLIPTAYGMGLRCVDTTTAGEVGYRVENTTVISMECLVTINDTSSNALMGFNDASDGTSATQDKTLYFDASNHLVAYAFDGGLKKATDATTVYIAGQTYHLCLVADGTNIAVFTNGIQTASTACGNTYTGYSTPHLCLGRQITPDGATESNNIFHYVGYANVGWTAAEVARRAQDVWGIFEEDDFIPLKAPAPSAFQVAWAMNASRLIGSGLYVS